MPPSTSGKLPATPAARSDENTVKRGKRTSKTSPTTRRDELESQLTELKEQQEALAAEYDVSSLDEFRERLADEEFSAGLSLFWATAAIGSLTSSGRISSTISSAFKEGSSSVGIYCNCRYQGTKRSRREERECRE
ncbi:DUF7342 family protein [Halostella salina]